MNAEQIQRVRRFNRTVTQRVGALDSDYLHRGRPLGEARLLHEVGAAGSDVRRLRETLRLDSGYVSRLLRSLEGQGLIETRPGEDGRTRRVVLTPQGMAEWAAYDALSDGLADSFLAPLDPAQRARLVAAMGEVERLLRAGSIEIRSEPPASPTGRWCLEQYFAELAVRFEPGFTPPRYTPEGAAEMAPPKGVFLVAWLDGAPAACGGLKLGVAPGMAEVKRVWTAPTARGLGIARRLLRALEDQARAAGAEAVRLDTNRALTEAQALYRQEGYREVARFNDEPYAHLFFEKRL